MDMFDEARAIEGTIRMCEITQEELARKLNVSQSYIANKLRLLKFSLSVQEMISEAGLSERHARTILRLTDEEAQKRAVGRVIKEELNVEMTEKLVDLMLAEAGGSSKEQIRTQALSRLSEVMGDCICTLARSGIRAKRITEEDKDGIRITLDISTGAPDEVAPGISFETVAAAR